MWFRDHLGSRMLCRFLVTDSASRGGREVVLSQLIQDDFFGFFFMVGHLKLIGFAAG